MLRCIHIPVLVAALAAGCLESNPQPSPVGAGGVGDDATNVGVEKGSPQVDEGLLIASAADDDGAVVLVGMDGCAIDADYAEAAPGNDGWDDAGDATSGLGGFAIDVNGGFGGIVPTVAGTDEIIVTFHFGPDFDPPVAVVPVPVPVLADEDDGRTPWLANSDSEYDPDQGAGAPSEDVWDAFAGEHGLGGVEVDLVGDMAAVSGLPWTTTPLSIVAVVNAETFLQSSTDADTSGGFALEIPAESGNTLLIYAVNPSDTEKATAPTAIMVP